MLGPLRRWTVRSGVRLLPTAGSWPSRVGVSPLGLHARSYAHFNSHRIVWSDPAVKRLKSKAAVNQRGSISELGKTGSGLMEVLKPEIANPSDVVAGTTRSRTCPLPRRKCPRSAVSRSGLQIPSWQSGPRRRALTTAISGSAHHPKNGPCQRSQELLIAWPRIGVEVTVCVLQGAHDVCATRKVIDPDLPLRLSHQAFPDSSLHGVSSELVSSARSNGSASSTTKESLGSASITSIAIVAPFPKVISSKTDLKSSGTLRE